MMWRNSGMVLVLGLVVLAGCAPRPPQAVYESLLRDVGDVDAGSEVTVTFPFRNSGTQPLRITGVQRDCGCIGAEYPETVPGGGRGEIRIKYNSNIAWKGGTEKHIQVQSNDARFPTRELTLRANIIPFFEVRPDSPVMRYYRRGEVLKGEISLKPREGEPLKLGEVKGRHAQLVTRPLPPGEHGEQRFAYELDTRRIQGDYNDVLMITTGNQRAPTYHLSFLALAAEGPVATPGEFVVPTTPANVDGKHLGDIRVFTRGTSLKVLEVRSPFKDLRIEVERQPGSREASNLKLFGVGEWESGLRQGVIRVRTDDPKSPWLVVPFSATVQ